MGQHLQLDDALLFGGGLRHLRHVFHHVRLHLHRHFLLELKLVQLLFPCLPEHLLSHLFLQAEDFDHPGFLPLEQLDDLGPVFVVGQQGYHVDVRFGPIDGVIFGGVDVGEGQWLRQVVIGALKTTDTESSEEAVH